MKEFTSISIISHPDGRIFEIKYFPNFKKELLPGTKIKVDKKEYIVKAIDRNRCSSFYVDGPWEERNIYIMAKENI